MPEGFRFTEPFLNRAKVIQEKIKQGERGFGDLSNFAREIGTTPRSLYTTLNRINNGRRKNVREKFGKEDEKIVDLVSEGGYRPLKIAQKLGWEGTNCQLRSRVQQRFVSLGLGTKNERLAWQIETNPRIQEAVDELKAASIQNKLKGGIFVMTMRGQKAIYRIITSTTEIEQKDIAKMFGCSQEAIKNAIRREREAQVQKDKAE